MNLVGLLARASLDRSNLPSASLHQWRARFDPPRLQWLGRSGVAPDSHTTPSHKFYTGWEGASQIVFIEAAPETLNWSASPSVLPASKVSRLKYPTRRHLRCLARESRWIVGVSSRLIRLKLLIHATEPLTARRFVNLGRTHRLNQ